MKGLWDASLALWSKQAGVAVPVKEYRFAPPRRWRFDYCWPDAMVALEVNGGVWTRGRHTRGQGYLNDLEKLNRAQLLGWVVLQVTPQQVGNGECVALIREALGSTPADPAVAGAL